MTNEEQIFALYFTEKRLIPFIFKEPLKFNMKIIK